MPALSCKINKEGSAFLVRFFDDKSILVDIIECHEIEADDTTICCLVAKAGGELFGGE